VVLVRPRVAENIGAAARIACNFGIERLIVVRDEPPAQEAMLKLATHKAAALIHRLELHRDLATALRPFQFVVGTTARTGRQRTVERAPRDVFAELSPHLGQSPVALVFGPENTGLANADLDLCHYISVIPTAEFSSLNLAQAVAIHAYECYLAAGRHRADIPAEDYANSRQLEGMFGHIQDVLASVDFLGPTDQDYWMRSIRRFLHRSRLRKKEATIIRGVCRKFLRHFMLCNSPPTDSMPAQGQGLPTTTASVATSPPDQSLAQAHAR